MISIKKKYEKIKLNHLSDNFKIMKEYRLVQASKINVVTVLKRLIALHGINLTKFKLLV